MNIAQWTLLIGGISAAIAVILNALGAHALSPTLSASGMQTLFATAINIHQIHALGLLLVGVLLMRAPNNRLWQIAAWLILGGQLLFAGNLYWISLYGRSPAHWLTPVGGLCLILGWLAVAAGALRRTSARTADSLSAAYQGDARNSDQ